MEKANESIIFLTLTPSTSDQRLPQPPVWLIVSQSLKKWLVSTPTSNCHIASEANFQHQRQACSNGGHMIGILWHSTSERGGYTRHRTAVSIRRENSQSRADSHVGCWVVDARAELSARRPTAASFFFLLPQGWLHSIESWPNLILQFSATMAAVEECNVEVRDSRSNTLLPFLSEGISKFMLQTYKWKEKNFCSRLMHSCPNFFKLIYQVLLIPIPMVVFCF